jgi:hypothetical protein
VAGSVRGWMASEVDEEATDDDDSRDLSRHRVVPKIRLSYQTDSPRGQPWLDRHCQPECKSALEPT